jgi:pimeloyl-ACP methyl ester carboxylesterase
MDDVALVLDTVGSQRTAFFGTHLGGRLALLFAATYPERTSAVVAHASHPASLRDEDFPWGSSPAERDRLLVSLQDGSFDPTEMMLRMAPHEMADPSFRQWWRMHNLSATTAPEAYDLVVALGPVDIRRLLGSIRVPPCCCTEPGTNGWMCTPAATWPTGSPGPGWWSCPAMIVCRASATRTPWSP